MQSMALNAVHPLRQSLHMHCLGVSLDVNGDLKCGMEPCRARPSLLCCVPCVVLLAAALSSTLLHRPSMVDQAMAQR